MNLKSLLFQIRRRLWLILKRYHHNKNRYDMVINPYDTYQVGSVTFYDDSLLEINNGVIKIIRRDFDTAYTKVLLNGKEIIIGIESWISSKIGLESVGVVNQRPLLKTESFYVYWENGVIYKQDCEGISPMSQYKLESFMYSEMQYKDGWYVLRTGGRIDISPDLQTWKTIYTGKRGIKDSMVIIGESGNLSLIFIEYTPGTVRERHHIWKYSLQTKSLKKIKTFYTLEEFKKEGKFPCARHLHVIAIDPYTNDIYVGSGDYENECNILVSKDNGDSFDVLYNGSQNYRALSFLFTKDFVYWNTDTHESQALFQLNKSNEEVNRFSLLNGALWCNIKFPDKINGSDFYIMSSNSEGALYDNNNRVYGISINNDTPLFYELLKKKSRTQYSQQFVLGLDFNNHILLLDTDSEKVTSYRLTKRNN